MMSVVRSLTDRGWRGEIYLLFSVRAVRDFVFRDELAYLQARFPNLHVRVLVSQDPDTPWDGLRGQITREVIADFVPDLKRGPVHAVRSGADDDGDARAARRHGRARRRGPPGGVRLAAARADVRARGLSADAAAVDDPADGPSASVVFTRTGRTVELSSDSSVLEAAEDNGIEFPFECRSGICGQCKTQLVRAA